MSRVHPGRLHPRSRPPQRPRQDLRLTAWVAVPVVAVAAIIGLLDWRAQAAQAQQARATELRRELTQDVSERRLTLAQPARDGRRAAAASRVLVGKSVMGWDASRDAEAIESAIERRASELREAADELADAGDHPQPRRPAALPAEVVDPVLDRLHVLERQAAEVANRLRNAADESETTAKTAHALTSAARRFIDATGSLPDSDEPDAVADGLRQELERLEPYRAAADAAAENEMLAPLAEAHLELISSLRAFIDEAVDALQDGDVAAYERLRTELTERFAAAIARLDQRAPSVAQTAVSKLEQAEARALGLLHELDRLRRSTPARLAVISRDGS